MPSAPYCSSCDELLQTILILYVHVYAVLLSSAVYTEQYLHLGGGGGGDVAAGRVICTLYNIAVHYMKTDIISFCICTLYRSNYVGFHTVNGNIVSLTDAKAVALTRGL